jgi:hypothetical protein
VRPPSSEADAASRRFSLQSETAVYCAIMKPQFLPASLARNDGRPLARGVTRRSVAARSWPRPVRVR